MQSVACVSPEVEPLDAPRVEDEKDELEDPEFELEPLPHGAEGGACLGSRPGGEPEAEAGERKPVLGQVQAWQLHRDLDQLRNEKELLLQRTRGELRASRQRMDLITRQQRGKAKASMTTTEREASQVNAPCHIPLPEGQMEGPQQAALEPEASGRSLQVQAAQQLSKEKEAWGKMERNRLLRVRRSMYLQKEHGLRHLKLMEDARRNHRVAVKFLKASLGRVQEQEQEREREAREHMQRRMDAVLALKTSITANRETLRKFQAWGQAKAELAAQKAQAEKQAILARGGDAFKLLFHQRRRQELEAQKRAFEEQQMLRKREIVGRLLKEEAEESKRKRPPSPPAAALATAQPSLRSKTWDYLADLSEGRTAGAAGLAENDSLPLLECSRLMQTTSSESVQGDSRSHRSRSWEEQTLAEPEISGLWNKGYEAHQGPKEDVDRKPVGGTKMEKDTLTRTMARLRSGVVHRQVVSGREFKGCPFNSKPQLIHFKDFDIGKVYKQRMMLINATYTINYCKLEGVDEHLRDFISIVFDPPGPMSAGMSCEVLVTFKPMVEKDLEGRIWFLAQTGRFSIPLKCSTKQCSVRPGLSGGGPRGGGGLCRVPPPLRHARARPRRTRPTLCGAQTQGPGSGEPSGCSLCSPGAPPLSHRACTPGLPHALDPFHPLCRPLLPRSSRQPALWSVPVDPME